MKVNILEADDRYKHYMKQKSGIEKICQKIIDQRPFGEYPFYIYGHTRTIELDEKISIFQQDLLESKNNLMYQRKYSSFEGIPEKRLIWQPRLTKPKCSSNSMLFKAYPGSDIIKTIWILPAPELWEQFEKDKLTENKLIWECITLYKTNRGKLEVREEDDLSDEKIDAIYREIAHTARNDKMMNRNYQLI
jgi:hypothetical protein